MQYIDHSHTITIEHGMPTCRGLPGPVVCDYLSRELYTPGTEFQIARIEMVANTV